MLSRPDSCEGCPLHPIASGFMEPSLGEAYKVALVGEALGKDEARLGRPFVGAAGHTLTRLIEWAGFSRSGFDIWNVAWCQPPDNRLDGEPYEAGAISHCRTKHWGHLTDRVNVIVPMGNVPLGAFTGRKGILKSRGYVRPGPGLTHLLPTVHPSFIRRGQSRYAAAFINDLQKAVQLAQFGLPIQPLDYLLDPSPADALAWAKRAVASGQPISFDIETPGKDEDEAEAEDDGKWQNQAIFRIGFSYGAYNALSIPFEGSYYAAIRFLLDSTNEKIVWNAGFDVPRLAAVGFPVRPPIHDGMVAWHILHSDLPKGLGFVSTFTCPWQPEWKHLSGKQPAFYNATDADVEWRSMDVITKELHEAGLWRVYERDVLEIDPILVRMSAAGMRIDPQVRLQAAQQLAGEQEAVLAGLTRLIPQQARQIDPKQGYHRVPADTNGMIEIQVEAVVKVCDRCGMVSPMASHFKAPPKKSHKPLEPRCVGAAKVPEKRIITRWTRLLPWKPSSQALMAYQRALGRLIPTKFDKKTRSRKPTMDEKALKSLSRQYPGETFYANVIQYRKLDKLAGTYIGRPVADPAGSGTDIRAEAVGTEGISE